VIFGKKLLLGNPRVRAPCLDIMKGWCMTKIVKTTMLSLFFWIMFSDCIVIMVVRVFVLLDSHFAEQHGGIQTISQCSGIFKCGPHANTFKECELLSSGEIV
jgi:hypothetical protein